MVAQSDQRQALAFKVLEDRPLYVGAFASIEQIEQ